MQLVMSDSLSKEEEDRIEAEYRAELESEHTERQLAQKRRHQKSKARSDERRHARQLQSEAEVKEKILADFHKEKGYKLYTDSAGREHWLTPEEYDWRMKARAQRDRNRKSFRPTFWARKRMLMMYGGAVLLAIALGLFLIR